MQTSRFYSCTECDFPTAADVSQAGPHESKSMDDHICLTMSSNLESVAWRLHEAATVILNPRSGNAVQGFMAYIPRPLSRCLASVPMNQLSRIRQIELHLVVMAVIHFCSSFLRACQPRCLLQLLIMQPLTCQNARAFQAQVSAAFDASCLSVPGTAGGRSSNRCSLSALSLGGWTSH